MAIASERGSWTHRPALPNARGWRHWLPAVTGLPRSFALCWYLFGARLGISTASPRHRLALAVALRPLQADPQGIYRPVRTRCDALRTRRADPHSIVIAARIVDLVSFPYRLATQQFVAALVVGIAAYWWLGTLPAIAVILLAFTFSPLAFYYTYVDGTWGGFFGWANALRYVTPLIVVPTLAHAAIRAVKRWTIVLLGAAWGLGSLLAQEGLTTTATASVMILTLLWLTRTISPSRAIWLMSNLAIGFACTLASVLVYYALHHAAGTFVRSYFFFARAVAVGYSNMWWPPQDSARPEQYSYYYTRPFIIGCGACALWRVPGLRLVAPLDWPRTRFLAFICVQLVCYQTALLGATLPSDEHDESRCRSFIGLGFRNCADGLATTGARQWAVRASFAALCLQCIPVLGQSRMWKVGRGRRAVCGKLVLPTPTVHEDRVAYKRMKPQLVNRTILSRTQSRFREFLEFVTEVHDVVGQRKTYSSDWRDHGRRLIAFMADLMLAPHPLGGELLSVNDAVKAKGRKPHPGRTRRGTRPYRSLADRR